MLLCWLLNNAKKMYEIKLIFEIKSGVFCHIGKNDKYELIIYHAMASCKALYKEAFYRIEYSKT